MRGFGGFVNGCIFALALLIGLAFGAVQSGLVPANADSKPNRIERWLAHASLEAAIARGSKDLQNPLQASDDNLIAGVHLYGANCAVCHGAADAKQSNPAKGFYIRSPALAKDGVEDDPESETFWKVKHGIRYTAMPSFGATLSDADIWKLAMFLKRMDKLDPQVDAEWKKIPSAATAASP